MAKQRGTSNVPMIMGIIGGVLGIPAAVCGGACAAGLGGAAGAADAAEVGAFYLALGVGGAILGFIGGLLGKKIPKIAGIVMLIATFMSGITAITNMLVWAVVILFLLGAIFCFVQKKEDVLA